MSFTRGGTVIAATALITLAALVLATRLRTDYQRLPSLDRSASDRPIAATFPEEQVLAVALDLGDATDSAMERLYAAFSGLDGIEVLAPEALELPIVSGDTLEIRNPTAGMAGDARIAAVRRLLDDQPFLAGLFRSPDGRARTLFLYAPPASKPAEFYDRALASIPADLAGAVRFWGAPYHFAVQRDRSSADARRLIPLAAFVVLLLHYWLIRDWLLALCLWTVSLGPALWTIALYPLFGLTFGNEAILVPLEVLALSTSYAIQYFRHATGRGEGQPDRPARGVVPIILLSAGTTLVGFASLMTIRIASIRWVGLFISLGIGISVFFALVFLPALLRLCPSYENYRTRPALLTSRIAGRRSTAAALVLALAFAAAGIVRPAGTPKPTALFRGADAYTRAADFFRDRFGGMEEATLTIETGEPYYFVDPVHYRALRGLAADLRADPRIGTVLAATDLVDWSFQRINASTQSPESPEAIGETMELIGGSRSGLSLAALSGNEASATRLVLRYNLGASRFAAFERALVDAAGRSFPSAAVTVAGAMQEREAILKAITEGMLWNVFSYMPLLFALAWIYFRSWRQAVQICLPSSVGLAVYFGAAGWFGWEIYHILAVGAAAVMGVAVDDVVHLTLTVRQMAQRGQDSPEMYAAAIATSGVSIIQTTVIIVVALAVLLLSNYTMVAQAGILSMLSMTAATATTLIITPRLARRAKTPPADS